MADLLAPVSALEVKLGLDVGSITGADLARATDALSEATDLVRAEGGVDWTTEDVPPVVRRVVVKSALRQYRNPDGYVSENMGGGAYAYRYADDETSAYLTGAEVRIVQSAAAAWKPRNFTGSMRTPSAYEEPGATTTVDAGWLMGE